MLSLADTIQTVADRIAKYNERQIGESNTRTNLIEPILNALGWNIMDLDEVQREYRGHGKNNPVDYALMILRKPCLVVEAKGLGEDIDDRRWLNQVVSYAAVLGVSWAVVTDGDTWKILNAMATVNVPDKVFRSVRISDGDTASVVDAMQLISREKMQGNDLDTLWQIFFTDRRVRDALSTLLRSGDKRIAKSVQAASESPLTVRDIQESLRRMDLQTVSEMPQISIPPAPAPDADGTAIVRRSNFNFQKMGLEIGSEIMYRNGGQMAVVNGPNTVLYEGKEWTLTALTKQLRGSTKTLRPSGFWLFGDKTLKEIYNETYRE